MTARRRHVLIGAAALATALVGRGWLSPDNARKPHSHLKNGEWNKYRVLAKGHEEIGKPFDLLGMDACLMSTLEVAYQTRANALNVVGAKVARIVISYIDFVNRVVWST